MTAQDDSPAYAGPVQPDGWQIRDWRQYSFRYSQALKVDRLSADDKVNLKRGVEYYLYGMTNPPEGETIVDLRRGLLMDLRSTVTRSAARTYLLEETLRICGRLLDQPPGPRLNVMIILASLATNPTPEPPRPYVPANEILLNVIEDPDQLVQCKIWAAIGLGRISLDGNPNIVIKNRIAVDLVAALDSPEARTSPDSQNSADWWYRMRLLDALGDNGLPSNINGQPIVIDAMTQILVDPAEHWMIRSTAARACTQLKWETGTNVSLINHEIGRLLLQMAEKYNQELAQAKVEAPYWRRCFFNIYLSYRPLTAEQRQRGWGLLQQAGARAAEVQAAYQVVLPVTNAVTREVDAQTIPQSAVDALGGWLENNPPDDLRVTPASEPLRPPGSPNTNSATSTLTPDPHEAQEGREPEGVADASES